MATNLHVVAGVIGTNGVPPQYEFVSYYFNYASGFNGVQNATIFPTTADEPLDIVLTGEGSTENGFLEDHTYLDIAIYKTTFEEENLFTEAYDNQPTKFMGSKINVDTTNI